MVDFIAFDSCINQKYRSVNVFFLTPYFNSHRK